MGRPLKCIITFKTQVLPTYSECTQKSSDSWSRKTFALPFESALVPISWIAVESLFRQLNSYVDQSKEALNWDCPDSWSAWNWWTVCYESALVPALEVLGVLLFWFYSSWMDAFNQRFKEVTIGMQLLQCTNPFFQAMHSVFPNVPQRKYKLVCCYNRV